MMGGGVLIKICSKAVRSHLHFWWSWWWWWWWQWWRTLSHIDAQKPIYGKKYLWEFGCTPSTPSSISSKPSNSQVWRKHRQEQASDLHVEPGDPDEGSSWRVALQWHWYLLMQGVLNEQNRANLKQVLIFNNWTQNAPGQIPSGWGAIPWSRCQTSPSSHSSGKIFPYPDYCF